MDEKLKKPGCDMVIACDLRNQGSKEGNVIWGFYFSIRQRYIFLKFCSNIIYIKLKTVIILITYVMSCIEEFHPGAYIFSL